MAAVDHDVIIVGARPAGAGAALLLARLGHRVLVVDRMRHGADTLSTHALLRAGVAQLDRWGLLEAVRAAGTPPVRRVDFDYHGERLPVPVGTPLYAPRRHVLDPIVADAAAAAGAQVEYGIRVRGLLREQGRVVGIHGTDRRGRPFARRATVVVGADGRTSTVARAVSAATLHAGTSASAVAYGYWSGMPMDAYRWAYEPGSSSGVIPTNDRLACVFVATPRDRFLSQLGADPGRAVDALLHRSAPDVAEQVAGAHPVGPVRGFPGTAGWIRRAAGPGWALVGDAAHFKDPVTAHGLSDALRDAEYLARALHQGLRSAGAMDAALAGYDVALESRSLEMLRVSDALAGHPHAMADVQALHLRLSTVMQQEVVDLEALPAMPDPVRH